MRTTLILIIGLLIAACNDGPAGGVRDLGAGDLARTDDLSVVFDLDVADLEVCPRSGPPPTCAGGPACAPGCWCEPQPGIYLNDLGGAPDGAVVGGRGPAYGLCVCGETPGGSWPFCCGGQWCTISMAYSFQCSAENDCNF